MHALAALLAAVSILVAPTVAHAAACVGDAGYPTVPFVDANCDGCFDGADGDDEVAQAELEQQPFLVPGCFVVPAGVHVNAKSIDWRADVDLTTLGTIAVASRDVGDQVRIRADRKLVVGGSIRTSLPGVRSDETNTIPVTLLGGDAIELLPRTSVAAKGTVIVDVDQSGELIVGTRTTLNAAKGAVVLSARAGGFFPIDPPAGHLAIGEGTQLKALRQVVVRAAGPLDVGAGVKIAAKLFDDDVPSVVLRAGYGIGGGDPDLGGDLTIAPKLSVRGPRGMTFEAYDAVAIGARAALKSKIEDLVIRAGDDVLVDDVRAAVYVVDAQSQSGDITMTGKVNLTNTGPVHFTATSGTCDLSGLAGIADADPLTYDCATVIAP